jgi:conjugal transfer mating pair stabilization protein TraG
MENYIIYSFGGYGELIWSIFNSIARIFASQSPYFTSVAKFSMTIGALWAATKAIFNTNVGIFGKAWFLPTFLAFTFLFSPKATVVIHDWGNKTTHTVAGIPFAIAFFSSTPSMIAYSLANTIEEEFGTPSALRSSDTGLMFGAKLVGKLKDIQLQDPILLDNAKEFTRQCFIRPWIMGNILGKRFEAENTNDLVGFLRQNKANNFGIYYKEQAGQTSFKTCFEVTEPILSAIEQQARSSNVLGNFGLMLGLNSNNLEQAARQITQTGNQALNSLAKSTSDVHSWVKQAMMLNAYRASLDDWREGAGHRRIWPELTSLSTTRGLYQQSIGWITAGSMAAELLPLMQTIVFLIITSSIVVVFPLSMITGGFEILKTWIQAMIWVHTWPIFFAIINCISNYVLAAKSSALGQDFGLTKDTSIAFSDMLIHTYAITQMLASTTPMISWMLISKSSMAVSSMVERMSPLAVASSLGVASADNSLNLDNVSYGNRQLSQVNVAPNLDMLSSMNLGSVKVMQGQDNVQFLEEKASSLATNYRGSSLESLSLNDSYAKSASKLAQLGTRESSLESLEQSQLQDYAKRWTRSDDASNSSNQRLASAMRIVAGEAITAQDSLSQKSSKGSDTSASINAGIGANILGIGATAASNISARNSIDNSKDSSSSESLNYQEAFEQVRDYAKTHDIRSSDGVSQNVSSALQDTWRQQESIAKEKSQTIQAMEQTQSQLSYLRQNSSSIDQNWNDQVLEAARKQQNLGSKQEALNFLNSNPAAGQQILRSLVSQKLSSANMQPSMQQEGQQERQSSLATYLPADVAKQSQHLRQKADWESQTQDILPKTQEKNQSQLKKEYNNRIESSTKAQVMKDSIQNNILQSKQQQRSNLQADEPKISAKVATSRQTATQHFNRQQQKFKDKSDLTTYRIGGEIARNINQTNRLAKKILRQNPITDSDTDQYQYIDPKDRKGR